MKKQTIVIIIGAVVGGALFFSAPKAFASMSAGFTDQTFYDCVEDAFKAENPSEVIPETGLNDEQLARLEEVQCANITSADGVEKLLGLKVLVLRYSWIPSIDLSHNLELEHLNLAEIGDLVEEVDITNNKKLTYFNVDIGKIVDFDTSELSMELNGKELKVQLMPPLNFLCFGVEPFFGHTFCRSITEDGHYSFDSDTGILTIFDVTDYDGLISVEEFGIPDSVIFGPFYLRMPYQLPEEPVVPEEPDEPEIPVPNTGGNTRAEEVNAEAVDYVAIVAGGIIAIMIAAYCGLAARRK